MYYLERPSERLQCRPPNGFIIVQGSNLLGDERQVSDLPELGQEGTKVHFLRNQGDKQEPCFDHHLQPLHPPRHHPAGRGIRHRRLRFVHHLQSFCQSMQALVDSTPIFRVDRRIDLARVERDDEVEDD